MRVLFVGLNYAPEPVGIAVYSADLCRYLAAQGHTVSVVTAPPYYPAWRIARGYAGLRWRRSRQDEVDITRCPLYVPANPTGLKRILHHLSFAASILLVALRRARRTRPQLVMTVAPSLIAAPVALIAAWAAGAKSWLHVQDFELDAAFATGLVKGGRITRLLYAYERWIFTRFDTVSSISPEMCARLRQIGVRADRVYELRNWADDRVAPRATPSSYAARWNIHESYVALYSGNIANKQGIDVILEAAELLADRRDLRFVICGEGANRAKLEARAAALGNVTIQNLQPTESLGDLLSLATVHLLPQRGDAADLVLPSKLTNMLASGRPVIATADPGTGLAREVSGAGLLTPPESANELANAIRSLIDDAPLRNNLSLAARERATIMWDRKTILTALVVRWRQLLG